VLDIEKSHEVLEVDLVSGYLQPEAFFLVPKVVLEVVVKPPGAALQERHTAPDLVPQRKAEGKPSGREKPAPRMNIRKRLTPDAWMSLSSG
jgi:hypothetical protein